MRGRLIVVRLEADGFLRHMVRAVVGTLVEMGERRRAEASVRRSLDSRDRTASGATAPAHGLVLVRVLYQVGPAVARPARSLYHEPLRSPGDPHGA